MVTRTWGGCQRNQEPQGNPAPQNPKRVRLQREKGQCCSPEPWDNVPQLSIWGLLSLAQGLYVCSHKNSGLGDLPPTRHVPGGAAGQGGGPSPHFRGSRSWSCHSDPACHPQGSGNDPFPSSPATYHCPAPRAGTKSQSKCEDKLELQPIPSELWQVLIPPLPSCFFCKVFLKKATEELSVVVPT